MYLFSTFLRHSLVFCLIIQSLISPLRGTDPAFVINAIVRAPIRYEPVKLESLEGDLKKIPFCIEKGVAVDVIGALKTTHPMRGRVVPLPPEALAPTPGASPLSALVGDFYHLLCNESFGDSPANSQVQAGAKLAISFLLNTLKSVDREKAAQSLNFQPDLPPGIRYKVAKCLWVPQWCKRVPKVNGDSHIYVHVQFDEVVKYYEDLKRRNPRLAKAFLQVNENQALSTIVPYRELRQELLAHPNTTHFVDELRAQDPNRSVYMAFLDSDTLSLRSQGQGLFSYYTQAIQDSRGQLVGATTGYRIGHEQDPFVSLAADFDLETRRAMASVLTLAPYYPEPNAIVRVDPGRNTVNGRFIAASRFAHKYATPQEMPELFDNMVQNIFDGNYNAAMPHFAFLPAGAIETTMPPRFQGNFKGKYDAAKQKYNLQPHDLMVLRDTAQSHLNPRQWALRVVPVLKALIKEESVNLVDTQQQGSTVSQYKVQVLRSLIASLYAAHSPLDAAISVYKSKGDPMKFLFDTVHSYDRHYPRAPVVTLGRSKSMEGFGRVLRANVHSVAALNGIIDRFFSVSQAPRIQAASMACGQSETSVISRYFQMTFVATVPRNPDAGNFLDLLFDDFQFEVPAEIQRAAQAGPANEPAAGPADAPDEPVAQAVAYPHQDLTVDTLKRTIRILYRRTSYAALDRLAVLNKDTVSRFMRTGKEVTDNHHALWNALKSKDWRRIEGQVITSESLATLLNIPEATLAAAKEKGVPFVDFLLHHAPNP